MKSKQNYQWNSLTAAACYYPEHWDRSLWENDLERMLDAGITVIRVAEFAWTIIEPEEGRFTFDFFDEFLDRRAGGEALRKASGHRRMADRQ